MKLSTRSRYSTRILIELAKNDDEAPLQVSEMSKRQNIPAKYLEQLIRTLKKAEIITSSRGPRGGYQLAKAADTITLGDIVRLFEGQSELVECISAPGRCPQAQECNVRIAWQNATTAMFKILDDLTIADLLCEKPSIENEIK